MKRRCGFGEHRIDRAAAVFAEELQIHLVAQQKRAVEPDEVRPAGEQARHRLVRLGEAVLVHEAAAAENAGRGDKGRSALPRPTA